MTDARGDAEWLYHKWEINTYGESDCSPPLKDEFVSAIAYALERDREEREKTSPGAVEKTCEWGINSCNKLWFRYCPICGGKIVPREVT